MSDSDQVWMNGLSCLNCGKGFYDGYNGKFTKPCQFCGSIAPSKIARGFLRKIIEVRDLKQKSIKQFIASSGVRFRVIQNQKNIGLCIGHNYNGSKDQDDDGPMSGLTYGMEEEDVLALIDILCAFLAERRSR